MFIPDLPGKKAQMLLAPLHRLDSLSKEQNSPDGATLSAVLALLYPCNDGNSLEEIKQWELLLILRTSYDGVHSGQVAFPGGKCEPQDKSHAATAAREAFEELGIEKESYRVIGELTNIYVPPSNFTIYPVLAISNSEILIDNQPDKKHQYKIEPREVVNFKRIPLYRFDPRNIKMTKVQRSNNELSDAPCYIIDDYTIWGATAMIISELYQLVEEAKVTISLNNA